MYENDIKIFLKNKNPNDLFIEEFAVGSIVGDLFNVSKNIVYEIKTKRDSLDRLDNQIKNYIRGFNNTIVVSNDLKKCNFIVKHYGTTCIGVKYINDNMELKTIKKHVFNDISNSLNYGASSQKDTILCQSMQKNPLRFLLLLKKFIGSQDNPMNSKIENIKQYHNIKPQ